MGGLEPQAVRKHILEVRTALGDRPKNSLFIETIPKRGYRFIAEVSVVDLDGRGSGPAPLNPEHPVLVVTSGDPKAAHQDSPLPIGDLAVVLPDEPRALGDE